MAFVSLKHTLEKVLKGYNITGNIESYKIFHLWPEIVGEKTAGHTKPSSIRENILYVEVDDPLWLTQLRYMKIDIMEKVDRRIKKGALKDIRFFLKNSGFKREGA